MTHPYYAVLLEQHATYLRVTEYYRHHGMSYTVTKYVLI